MAENISKLRLWPGLRPDPAGGGVYSASLGLLDLTEGRKTNDRMERVRQSEEGGREGREQRERGEGRDGEEREGYTCPLQEFLGTPMLTNERRDRQTKGHRHRGKLPFAICKIPQITYFTILITNIIVTHRNAR